MGAAKIFKVLGTIVGCVVVAAWVLNLILPNVLTTMCNTFEGMIYNMSGISVDFNGDGILGEANSGKEQQAGVDNSEDLEEKGKVKGFSGGGN